MELLAEGYWTLKFCIGSRRSWIRYLEERLSVNKVDKLHRLRKVPELKAVGGGEYEGVGSFIHGESRSFQIAVHLHRWYLSEMLYSQRKKSRVDLSSVLNT